MEHLDARCIPSSLSVFFDGDEISNQETIDVGSVVVGKFTAFQFEIVENEPNVFLRDVDLDARFLHSIRPDADIDGQTLWEIRYDAWDEPAGPLDLEFAVEWEGPNGDEEELTWYLRLDAKYPSDPQEPTNPARLPGDADNNSAVDFDDFLILASNFGATDAVWEDGDFDDDQDVTFDDFLILAANFGATSEGAARP